jgi:hypothetical protein
MKSEIEVKGERSMNGVRLRKSNKPEAEGNTRKNWRVMGKKKSHWREAS